MRARAAVRGSAARRSGRRKAGSMPSRPGIEVPEVQPPAEPEDWVDADESNERLEEGEMEILLTGHAASHGFEEEDNWLIKTEEESWGQR